MSEYEKSELGLPHVFDSEMMEMFRHSCHLNREYNLTGEEDAEERNRILSMLLKKKDRNRYIIPDFHTEFGFNITIGDNVIINTHCILMDNREITIGSNVLFGPNVSLYTVNHSLEPAERRDGICIAKPITIEDDTWLCGNVTVTSGVTIGKGSVIAAGSVVRDDIPRHVLAAGNPCRVIREITDNDRLIH